MLRDTRRGRMRVHSLEGDVGRQSWARLALIALVAVALVRPVQTAAQNGWPTKWELSLSLPSTSQEALSSRSGLPWDQLRENGLVLTATGSGQASLAVFVLRVRDGRIVGRWSSGTFPVTGSGRIRISGHYLPGKSSAGDPLFPHPSAGSNSSVQTDAIMTDIEGGTVGFAKLGSGSSLVIVVLPTAGTGASGSETNPLFFKSESYGDGP
jgi:hypothetical protein